MAADLEADLAEAAADGAAPEDVLGTGAFDPQAFAASWAAERGVIVSGPTRSRSRRIPVALAAFVALAVIGLILLLATPTRTVRVAVAGTAPRVAFLRPPLLRRRPLPPRVWVAPLRRAQVLAAGPGGRTPAWWVGLGALVVGSAGAAWSTLALRR
jgi:hypothetical protein